MRTLFVLAALAAASLPTAASAQMLPSIASVQDSYSRLKIAAKPGDDLKRDLEAIDRAVADAVRFGRLGEARRLLAKGAALASGTGWTDVDDFANSIVLRTDRLIADPIRPLALRVEQIYGSTLILPGALSARMSLHRLAAPSAPSPIGEAVRDYGAFERVARDLRESPYLADLDLAGIDDGSYVVVVTLLAGERPLVTRGLVVEVRKNLDARAEKLEAGARAKGGLAETLRADLLYPVDHIRLVNRGVVEPGGFDVERALTAAEDTLAAIAARRDSFAGRTGTSSVIT